jgi:AraC-like DNA-binding protein
MPIPSGYHEILHNPRDPHGLETVWTSFSTTSGEHLVLPDGRGDIILRFNVVENCPVAPITLVLAGPSTSYHSVKLSPDLCFIGARLRPGFLHHVLKLDPSSLRNKVLVGQDALAAVPRLVALVAPASSIDALIERLKAFVRDCSLQTSSGKTKFDLIDAAHASGGRLSVSELGKLHCLSARTVHRYVVGETGLAPKELNQILQFHRALRLLRDHGLHPADAAFESGYADQAHMTRAFRKFGGFTPANLPDVVLVTIPA